MKVGVIGGGLCGLVAAYRLSGQARVDLFERKPVLGGCLASYPLKDTWIEQFYHHCFAGDSHLLSLVNELGLGNDLEWLTGTTGFCADNTIYPLTTPLEILKYPYLTLSDTIRLAWLTLRSRSYDSVALDEIPARTFIVEHCGERAYAAFFEPLLKSKFGGMRDQVSAAWLVSRVAIRSNRTASGERLGYLKGGFQGLISGLEQRLKDLGCTILMEHPAHALQHRNGTWHINDQPYDAVIATVPPQTVTALGGPSLPAVPYQGAACMTLGLERDVTDGIYWVNMKDPAPYGAVIGHTNFVPPERYGEHIVYLASYFSGAFPSGRAETMLRDFQTRFGVADHEVRWCRLAVEPAAGPVYTTGFQGRIPPYHEGGLFLAGMFSRPNYPERSMEGAVIAGTEVAARVSEVVF